MTTVLFRTLLSLHIFCPYLRRSIYTILYVQFLDKQRPLKDKTLYFWRSFSLFSQENPSNFSTNSMYTTGPQEFTKAMAGILFTSAASERGMDYPDVAWATVGGGSWRMAMQVMIRSAISFFGLTRDSGIAMDWYCFCWIASENSTYVGTVQENVQV